MFITERINTQLKKCLTSVLHWMEMKISLNQFKMKHSDVILRCHPKMKLLDIDNP